MRVYVLCETAGVAHSRSGGRACCKQPLPGSPSSGNPPPPANVPLPLAVVERAVTPGATHSSMPPEMPLSVPCTALEVMLSGS